MCLKSHLPHYHARLIQMKSGRFLWLLSLINPLSGNIKDTVRFAPYKRCSRCSTKPLFPFACCSCVEITDPLLYQEQPSHIWSLALAVWVVINLSSISGTFEQLFSLCNWQNTVRLEGKQKQPEWNWPKGQPHEGEAKRRGLRCWGRRMQTPR